MSIEVKGIPYIEFAASEKRFYDILFKKLGFVKDDDVGDSEIYKQNDITFVVYTREFSKSFFKTHGPSVASFGFSVDDPDKAMVEALRLECIDVSPRPYLNAIDGVGGSRIFLSVEQAPSSNIGVGLTHIDHLTNNVYPGNMEKWADFYKRVFGFKLLKHFDITGKQTGLVSHAMGNDKIAIPINEDKSSKGQIAEYLKRYNGEGVQHIALLTNNIYTTVEQMRKNGVNFLDVPDAYYDLLDSRIPNHGEDIERLKKNNILVDGKEGSILLQIFTRTVIGPIFFEIIQRKNNKLFGDGNFQALFESIELDQIRRGVLWELFDPNGLRLEITYNT